MIKKPIFKAFFFSLLLEKKSCGNYTFLGWGNQFKRLSV